LLAGVVGAGIVQAQQIGPAEAQAIIREHAATWGVSGDRLVSVARCETGNSWRTDLIGRQGEVGPFQLLPGRGNGLDTFYRWGYSDPTDWHDASDFAARMFAAGRGGEWHC
jgi:hypothetical protein